MRMWKLAGAAGLLAAVPACQDRPESDGDEGGVVTITATADESGGDGDGDGDGDDGEKFDVGGTSDDDGADDGGEQGCRGVDFLFVVDNSGSMQDEQNNLITSFPKFMQTIQQTLQDQAQDFHVLLTDTDASSNICAQLCMQFPNLTCNGVPCAQLPPPGSDCDSTLGAGKTTNGAGQNCGITSGKRFMDSSQPNLEQTFSCLGAVGTMGDGAQRQLQAILASFTPPSTAHGDGNEFA